MFVIFFRGGGWAMIGAAVALVVLANRLINGSFDLVDSPVTSVGLIIAGILIAVVGWYLNITAPKKFRERLAQEGLGRAMKLTPEQFAASEAVNPGLIAESAQHKTVRNYHTLLFIPIQVWGVAMSALGVWLLLR